MGWFDDLIVRLRPRAEMVDAWDALPGRPTAIMIPKKHFVNGNPIAPPFPEGLHTAVFSEGCFWGAERGFWELGGVYSTAVGYAGGHTPNPTYEEVCSGRTNDHGTQYRSAIYTTDDAQLRTAQDSARDYGAELAAAGYGEITTEIAPLREFYYAEDYHQQYLAKKPQRVQRPRRHRRRLPGRAHAGRIGEQAISLLAVAAC